MRIIQNAIYVPELNQYFISSYTHDFVKVRLPDGKCYAIDGGNDYLKAIGDLELEEEGRIVPFHLSLNSSNRDVINKLLWGSRGINGDQPLTYKPIRFLSKGHINNILKLDYISPIVRDVCEYWTMTHEIEAKEIKEQITIEDSAKNGT